MAGLFLGTPHVTLFEMRMPELKQSAGMDTCLAALLWPCSTLEAAGALPSLRGDSQSLWVPAP
jgi:hypothetical protein